MIHYVVVVGHEHAVRSRSEALPEAVMATRLFDGDLVNVRDPGGLWAMSAIEVADPICSPRVAMDARSLAVVNGPVFVQRGQDRADVEPVELVRRHFAGGTPERAFAMLRGAYNCVTISPSDGLRAAVDFSGQCPLYYLQLPDCVVISNRSTTVARVGGRSGWNVMALAWVIAHGTLCGDEVPARDVRHLPPGMEARVAWQGDHLELVRSTTWIWPDPLEQPTAHDLTPQAWDRISADLVANFEALGALDGPLVFALTGGKDSRLSVALAKAAGLGDRVKTFTRGATDNPDVQVATAVAAKLGVDHQRTGRAHPTTAPAGSPPGLPPEEVWARTRQHAYRYEGIVSAWTGQTRPLAGTSLQIHGFGGELYRRGNRKVLRGRVLDTHEAMAAALAERMDRLGVMTPVASTFQQDWFRRWVRHTSEFVRLDALPEKLYIDSRVSHWNGPLLQSKFGLIHVNPLVSAVAAHGVLGLDVDARSTDRFHFEVLRRAAPEVVDVPFLNDTWGASADAGVAAPKGRTAFPNVARPTSRNLTRWQWAFIETQGAQISDLLQRAGRATDLGEVCDIKRMRKVAQRPETIKGGERARQLISAVGAAVLLLGEATPVLDTPGD